MGMDSVADLLHVAHKRYDVLRFVAAGELDKGVIESRIDASRPTVDRAFRELEDVGVLTSEGTTYELTRFGALYCETFRQATDDLETLAPARAVLSSLPPDAAVGRDVLDGAEVYQANRHASQEPFTEVAALARDAAEIRGYSSSLMPYYVEVFRTLVVEEEIPTTLVLTTDVVETARTRYADAFDEILGTAHATLYETSTVTTYGLLVTDDAVAVPVGSERDRLRGVVVNDTDAAREWADDYFERLVDADSTHRVSSPAD